MLRHLWLIFDLTRSPTTIQVIYDYIYKHIYGSIVGTRICCEVIRRSKRHIASRSRSLWQLIIIQSTRISCPASSMAVYMMCVFVLRAEWSLRALLNEVRPSLIHLGINPTPIRRVSVIWGTKESDPRTKVYITQNALTRNLGRWLNCRRCCKIKCRQAVGIHLID